MNQQSAIRRRSIVGPLFLIGAGVLFLFSNLGLVSGNIWDLIFRYWPVLLIIAGLDAIFRREGLFTPVVLISLGTIILMINLGYLSWSIWGLVFRYWPVLIILAGVSIVFHRSFSTWWGALITLFIVVALAAGIVRYAGQQPVLGEALPTSQVQESLGSASEANITISPAAGIVNIHSNPESGSLISGKVITVADEKIDQQNLSQGSTAIYTIHSRGLWRTTTFGQNAPVTWDLGITSEVPVALFFELGAGQANLDLRGIMLKHLKVNTAVSALNVTLPEQGNFIGTINGAIGDLVVYVPKDLSIQIHASGGLNSLDVPARFTRNGNDIISSAASITGPIADLQISQAIGGLTIRELP